MPHDDDSDRATQRVAKRDSLFLLAELFDGAGKSIATVRVRNLSSTGMMAECNSPLKEGDRIRLSLRGTGEIAGRISWVIAGRVGVAFDEKIDPAAARRPIAASQPAIATAFGTTRFGRPPR